jgi:hypothetical protein
VYPTLLGPPYPFKQEDGDFWVEKRIKENTPILQYLSDSKTLEELKLIAGNPFEVSLS